MEKDDTSATKSALAPGQNLEHYVIERVLGASEYGITYLAEHAALEKKYAIKEYFARDFATRDGGIVVPKDLNRSDYKRGLDHFLTEARTLARLRDPAIISVHHVFEGNGTAYIVMEYEPGQRLADWLHSRDGTPTQDQIDSILEPLLHALETLHDNGLQHRDITPKNIVIRDDGSPVLLGFGSPREATGEPSQVLSRYAPPEQHSSKVGSEGPASDIYALGATAYQMITGNPPQVARDRVRKDDMVPASEAADGAYRASFLEAIDWSLKLATNERPQSVAAWRERLFDDRSAPTDTNKTVLRNRATDPEGATLKVATKPKTAIETAQTVVRSVASKVRTVADGATTVVDPPGRTAPPSSSTATYSWIQALESPTRLAAIWAAAVLATMVLAVSGWIGPDGGAPTADRVDVSRQDQARERMVPPVASPQPGLPETQQEAPTPQPEPESEPGEDKHAFIKDVPKRAETPDPAPAPAPTGTPGAAAAWDLYRNARFGFEFEYPSDVLRAQPPSPNGDGRTFQSSDGKVAVTGWGGHNADRLTAKAFREDFEKDNPGGTLVHSEADLFMLVYETQELRRYIRVLLACDRSIVTAVQFTYPTAPDTVPFYEEMFERIVRTFKVKRGEDWPETCGGTSSRPPPAPAQVWSGIEADNGIWRASARSENGASLVVSCDFGGPNPGSGSINIADVRSNSDARQERRDVTVTIDELVDRITMDLAASNGTLLVTREHTESNDSVGWLKEFIGKLSIGRTVTFKLDGVGLNETFSLDKAAETLARCF